MNIQEDLQSKTDKSACRNKWEEYRKVLEKDYIDQNKDIDHQLSYITTGALVFFATIQSQFVNIRDAEHHWLLLLGIFSLFAALALMFHRREAVVKDNETSIRAIDDMPDESNEYEQELLDKWEKKRKRLNRIRMCVYIALGIGIVLQFVFLCVNLNNFK